MDTNTSLPTIWSALERSSDERCRRFLIGVALNLTVAARECYLGEGAEIDAAALGRFNELQHQILGFSLCESWEGGRSPAQFLQDLVHGLGEFPRTQRQVVWAIRTTATWALRPPELP